MIVQTSRRSLLRLLSSAPFAAAPALAAPTAETDPFTPAEYLNEMQAIGWRAVAACWHGNPQSVIEYGPRDERHGSIENRIAFMRIQARVPAGDFWRRTSRYLFDLGLREEVGPHYRPARSADEGATA
ncbi:MAG: hypothetical protein ACLPX7_02545 [Xanthobacteraceae bacterium]